MAGTKWKMDGNAEKLKCFIEIQLQVVFFEVETYKFVIKGKRCHLLRDVFVSLSLPLTCKKFTFEFWMKKLVTQTQEDTFLEAFNY